jgi:signal transduction histidine kinase
VSIFSSLTNRIFVASALLAVVSISIGIYKVNVAVTAQAENELLRGVDEARVLIEENRRSQVEHFTVAARLIADTPRLKAAADDNDASNAFAVIAEFQDQLHADLMLVTNRHGQVLAQVTGGDFTEAAGLMPEVVHEASWQEVTTFFVYPRGILQLVSVPIWIDPDHPDILGTLSLGFSLDRRAAHRFQLLTNSDVAFGIGDRVLASTLPDNGWSALVPLLGHNGLAEKVWLGDNEYIARTVELASDGGTPGPRHASLGDQSAPVKAIILRSRTARLSFLRPLHTSLMITAVVAVLAATFLSYGIARTVTRPLGTITATMRELAATGDLTRRIPVHADSHWEDEDARLLASTFNTMTESIERFQREAAQRERLSSLGRLSTVVAHEIRNPLMIIKAALRVLRKEHVADSEVKVAVADIDEEIVRLNRIVSEVLDFAKPIKFDLAPVDLNALCADAAKASDAESSALPVRFKRNGDIPEIVTDAERLRLVLVNLLTNARHAVAGREGAAVPADAITIAAGLAGHERSFVEVRDRGTGIAPEDLPKIFDPYFTTRRTGTGLGLAISRNIVEGLGGTIAVYSRRGEGTVVRLELPAR